MIGLGRIHTKWIEEEYSDELIVRKDYFQIINKHDVGKTLARIYERK